MARTPFLEKKWSVRTLGAAFIALMLFLVWVTYAFFDKKFVSSEPVFITTQSTGVNLPQNADVKLRGMIVGEVRKIEPNGDGVKLTLAMNPDLLKEVPRDVTAQILPKTLFGEKFVSLIPEKDASAAKLRPGDTITQASVPIEVEELLNDAYPLLTAVDPANLSYTLTAVSDALSGRGTELGETLVSLNSYLKELNPDVPQLVTDLDTLGTVADGYADAMPDLGRLLTNAVTTGNTVVEKKSELAAFFDEGSRLADTLTDFTAANADNLKTLSSQSRPFLEMLGDYSPTFPCFLGGLKELIPRLDSAFRDQMLHINLKVVAQPTAYKEDEILKGTQADFDAASTGTPAKNGKDVRPDNAALPTCLDLDQITPAAKAANEALAKGDQAEFKKQQAKLENLSSQSHPFAVPAAVYKLVNIKSDHNKYGDGFRVAPASATNGSFFSPAGTEALRTLLGAAVGTAPDQVPDLATLLLAPAIQGAGVSVE